MTSCAATTPSSVAPSPAADWSFSAAAPGTAAVGSYFFGGAARPPRFVRHRDWDCVIEEISFEPIVAPPDAAAAQVIPPASVTARPPVARNLLPELDAAAPPHLRLICELAEQQKPAEKKETVELAVEVKDPWSEEEGHPVDAALADMDASDLVQARLARQISELRGARLFYQTPACCARSDRTPRTGEVEELRRSSLIQDDRLRALGKERDSAVEQWRRALVHWEALQVTFTQVLMDVSAYLGASGAPREMCERVESERAFLERDRELYGISARESNRMLAGRQAKK